MIDIEKISNPLVRLCEFIGGMPFFLLMTEIEDGKEVIKPKLNYARALEAILIVGILGVIMGFSAAKVIHEIDSLKSQILTIQIQQNDKMNAQDIRINNEDQRINKVENDCGDLRKIYIDHLQPGKH